MSYPNKNLVWMIVFLFFCVTCLALLGSRLFTFLNYNPILNSVIFFVFLIGIGYSFLRMIRLRQEVRWAQNLRYGQQYPADRLMKVNLLAPLAAIIQNQRPNQSSNQLTLNTSTLRSLLDGIGIRLDEAQAISRYLISLMIFLGLLGTFWGLLQTVGSVGETINQLNIGNNIDASLLFNQLKSGLNKPLSGMGIAFSSSLFGLAGSLVLGFLELQTSQAHNRFLNELEDWLASRTKLGNPFLTEADPDSSSGYLQALVEQSSDSMLALQHLLQRQEDNKTQSNTDLHHLTERLGQLVTSSKQNQQAMHKVAETQSEVALLIQKALLQISQAGSATESFNELIQTIDTGFARILQEMVAGRQHTMAELRSEIKMLARTIAAVSGQE